jgi:exonuclease III
MIEANEPPSRTEGSGTFRLATYNVRSGRNGGLESALRAMDSLGVDIGLFQETKLTGDIYTRFSSGYSVIASNAPSAWSGGVAFFYREHDSFEVEEQKIWGPNVLSFQMVTGRDRYFVVGAYISPTDLTALADVDKAWKQCPKGCKPMLLGDLNINLEYPRNERDVAVAEQIVEMDLTDMSRQFCQRRRRRIRGRWTWRQRRRGRWVSSQADYLLAREGDRRRFRNVALRKPHNHDSDHRATIATIYPGSKKHMKAYRKKRHRFPIRLPRHGPRTLLESKFEALREDISPPAPRARKSNHWISPATWKLVDHRAMLRRKGQLAQQGARKLGREIKASLKSDRRQRAADTASAVERNLEAGDPKEAWRCLKGWYRAVEDRAPKPCYDSMDKQTTEREKLYEKVPPPGDPIPINVDKFDVIDDCPEDAVIREVVKCLRNGRAGGASRMRAEDIKGWLRGIIEEEEDGREGAGDKWRAFVELIQAVWEHGEIPQQLSWIIIVLLPKGGGDYRGIGLLEPLWKCIEILMDKRLQVIEFHDCLHGFLTGRGTGTATTEVKLAQQLAYLEQQPLYGIFIDLKKAYDAMDRDRCLEILVAYGVGPKLIRLLRFFWENAEMVCRAGGCYGRPFKAHRGVTQGGPFSPRIFNVMVDAVVREWLRQVLGEDVARSGVGEEIRHFLVAFYADDGLIQARCPERLQSAFDILIELFERVGLVTNTRKTKAMVCIPGRIRTRLTDDVYNNSRVGLMSREEWNRRRVECDICQQEVSAESLTSHLETQHDIFRSFVLNRDLVVEREPVVHNATYSYYSKRYPCPVPGCTGGGSTKWNLRRHFSDRHPSDLVNVPGEGIYRKCERCGMQVSPLANNHERSAHCWDGWAKRLQHEAAEHSAQALDAVFTAYGEELERVEVFKYLGRLLAYDDNDAQALRGNLKKARKCWARLSRVLKAENASPRVCGMFYKATVQAVLLFGSETWNLPPSALKCLEGFHLRAARRMTGMMPCEKPDGSWTYPASEEVLEKAGLYTIAHYMEVRRNTILNFIVNRPIHTLCQDAVRKRGTGNRQYWWEQPMDLEAARASAVVAVPED